MKYHRNKFLGKTAYRFLSSIFNLFSNSTINQYDTLDSNAEDGIMFQTIADMEHDFDKLFPSPLGQSLDCYKWKWSGVLKFDEMKIKEKIVFNMHTNEIIGFEGSVCNTGVIATELESMLSYYSWSVEPSKNDIQDTSRKRPCIAKHILVFMFILWDKESSPMKRVVHLKPKGPIFFDIWDATCPIWEYSHMS